MWSRKAHAKHLTPGLGGPTPSHHHLGFQGSLFSGALSPPWAGWWRGPSGMRRAPGARRPRWPSAWPGLRSGRGGTACGNGTGMATPFGGGGTGEEGSDRKEGGLVSLSLALTLTPIRFQFAKVDPASSQRRISQENAPRPWLIDDFGPASWGSTSGEGRQPVQRARGDRHGWKPLPPGLGPRGGGGAET